MYLSSVRCFTVKLNQNFYRRSWNWIWAKWPHQEWQLKSNSWFQPAKSAEQTIMNEMLSSSSQTRTKAGSWAATCWTRAKARQQWYQPLQQIMSIHVMAHMAIFQACHVIASLPSTQFMIMLVWKCSYFLAYIHSLWELRFSQQWRGRDVSTCDLVEGTIVLEETTAHLLW